MQRLLALILVAATARSAIASPVDILPRQGTTTVNAPDPTVTEDPENGLYPPAQSIVVNPSPNPSLISQLELAATSVDRFTILKDYGEQGIKFDFNIAANPSGGVSAGLGGQGNLADRKTFPALISLGVAMSAGFLQPCGMNTPHLHNRATEFLTVVQGGNVHTGFVLENGFATQMSTTLDQFQGAILPQGSIHFEFNDNCEPAVFMAAFSHEDPGLSSVAQNFFSLDPNIVDADLGYPRFLDGTNIAQFEKTIPKSFAYSVRECLDRCGIPYNSTRS